MPTPTTLNRAEIQQLFPRGSFKAIRAYEEQQQAVSDVQDAVTANADATQTQQEATYLTLSANAALPNERVLAVGQGLALTDAGPGGNLVIRVRYNLVLGGGYRLALNLIADSELDLPTSGTVLTREYIYPGPYADDAAAGTAGVAVGAQYRRSDGVMAWRVA